MRRSLLAMSATAKERGQGIVEFAVIFPIFAIFLFAVIDGGLVMGRYNTANQATGVGSRLAATGTSPNSVRTAVQNQMHDALAATDCDADGDDVCVDYRSGPNGEPPGEAGSIVVVYLTYEYDLLTPLEGIARLLGGTGANLDNWEIEACSYARVERHIDDAEENDDSSALLNCD